MKRIVTNLLFLIFSLFASAQISKTGIHTEQLKTPDGIIEIKRTEYLPKGKNISGTVSGIPDSENSNRRKKQAENLANYSLKIGEQVIPVAGIFSVKLPVSEILPMQLYSPQGKLLNEVKLNLTDPIQPAHVKIPKTIRHEYTEKITGPFSGDISQAKIDVNGNPANLIAGNDVELFFEITSANPGKRKLTLEYGDIKASESVNLVDYSLRAGKLNLNRGETTILNITVAGLEELQDVLSLEIENQSAETVTLEGGKRQVIAITPEEVAGSDTWSRQFNIQSIARGSFSISANLEIQERPGPEKIQPVSCNLYGQPVTLTQEQCKKLLQQQTSLPENRFPFPANEPIPEFSLLPEPFDLNAGNLFRIEPVLPDGFNPFFIVFSITDLLDNHTIASKIDTLAVSQNPIEIPETTEPGLYAVEVTAGFGKNQTVTAYQFFYLNGSYSYSGISGPEIRRLDDEIDDARDEANRLRGRYDGVSKAKRENERRAQEEDYDAWEDGEMAQQLEEINQVLDHVENIFADDLKKLLDSIVHYPPRPDTTALRAYLGQLEAELEECKKQLAELQQEKKQLEQDIPAMENQQEAAFQKIVDAFKSTGHNFMARHSRGDDGSFSYSYTIVLGTTGYKNHVPAEIASEVGKLDKEIDNLEQQLRQSRKRLAELPQIIADKQKECDDLSERLENAREALEKGIELAENYGEMQLAREDICRRIKAITQRLVCWCESNPELCPFGEELTELLDDCPKDSTEAQNYWDRYNSILKSKKQIEDDLKQSAADHAKKAEELSEEAENQGKELDDIWEDLGRLARRITDLERKKEQAIKDEAARIARLTREKKRACEKILESQGIAPEDASVLKDLEAIKNEIQKIGGMISDAAKLGEKIPNEKIKELAEKLGKGIDELLGPLEKYDELKETAEELLDIKDKLETLFSEGDSPSERAEKFGAYLELVNKLVSEIGDKFPILKFFTAYFDYLVQGYLAAVDGAQRAFTDRYEEIIESALARVNCETLLEKYMENNSFESMYNYAYKACGASYYGQNQWQKEAFEKIVREKALKKIIDCCLDDLAN